MAKSRPHVILSAALSIDGKIATRSGFSKISSKKDKQRLHKLRAKVDAILVGKNTVQRDNPILTVRYAKGKNPIRIIMDSTGSISSNSKIIKSCNKVPTIISVSKKISSKNLQRLGKFPLDLVVFGEKKVDIKKLLQYLAKQKIKTLLLEGGGTVNWEFIEKDFVDEVIVTLAPYVIGGRNAISLVGGKGFSKISNSRKFMLKRIVKMGNEIVLHYSHP